MATTVILDDRGTTHNGDDHGQGLHQQSTSDAVHIAGLTLVDTAGKYTTDDRRKVMTDQTRAQIDECFAAGSGHSAFNKHHIEALRLALGTGYFDMATALLEKDPTHRFLTHVRHVLQPAIATESSWSGRHLRESEGLPHIVRLLIAYGAQPNDADADGKTPLYYACAGGCAETFKVLITSGADYHTIHHAIPNSDVDMEVPACVAANDESPKANLLDIALESQLGRSKRGPVSSTWKDARHGDWGYIITFLLQQGLSFRSDDSRLAKFFHIACFQGNMTHIQILLDHGIDQNARAGRSDDSDNVFGSALHVAVRAGQSAVVKSLLNHGAIAHAPRPCSDRSLELNPMIPITPIVRAFGWDTLGFAIGTLDACELLVDAGANENDCKILLEQCVKRRNVEISKRLLDRGVRLPEIPLTDDMEIILLFLAAGTEQNASAFQQHAVEEAHLDLMKFLVAKYGPVLPMNDFGHTAFKLLKGESQDHMAMLQFLITEYGLDVNTKFPVYSGANSHVNLLQQACEECKPPAVQLLLEEGADPQCPGLTDSALAYLKSKLRCRSLSVGLFAGQYMPIIRLLQQYTKDAHEFNLPTMLQSTESQPSQTEKVHSSTSQPSGLQPTTSQDGSRHERSEIGARANVPPADPCPWIEATVDVYQYEKLQALNAFRLVELEPSQSTDDPIRCKVVHGHLSTNPDYEVLSCGVGASCETIPILLDEKTLEVPADLWCALRRIRREARPRLFWNNAICINPNDIQERNQQASLLKDILQKAGQLLVWLGEAADNSHLVFNHHNNCKSMPLLGLGLNDSNLPRYAGETKEAFLKLCQRPWFFRVWSAPEIAWSKKNAILMCGQDEGRLHELTECSSPVHGYHPVSGVHGPCQLRSLDQLTQYYYSIIWVFRHIAYCPANDPREKVFGVAALIEKLAIPIDYGANTVDVFRDFTQRFIEVTQDIHILHWLGTRGRMDDLPSWVPDFSAPISSTVLPRTDGSACYQATYPSTVLPGIRFRSDGALIMQGRPIEKILAVGEELPIDSSVTPGTETFSRILHGWELLATQLLSSKRFSQAISDAFSDTLTACDDQEQLGKKRPPFNTCAEDFARWYRRYGSGVLAETDKAYFEEMEIVLAWIQDIKCSLGDSHQDGLGIYARKMEVACYGRRFFITDQGSMGLAPARARADDELIFFPGGLYPFVVRGRDDGTSELIGDCYLYDFYVFGLFEDATRDTREYVLL
ncbi:MAG: hypothetical protein L6R39_002200 [Caloplaca ligustica]|nr:MAG: hypothetical protein L6R39_002200 [Caloplaca ligustica]